MLRLRLCSAQGEVCWAQGDLCVKQFEKRCYETQEIQSTEREGKGVQGEKICWQDPLVAGNLLIGNEGTSPESANTQLLLKSCT